MDDKAARALAGAMASLASGGDPAMAAPVTARLAGLSGRDWLRLDESARRTYWGESALDRVGDWRPALTAADGTTADGTTAEWVTADWVTAVRIAASMCRDGRVREAATVALAGRLLRGNCRPEPARGCSGRPGPASAPSRSRTPPTTSSPGTRCAGC